MPLSFILINSYVYRKVFTDEYHPSGILLRPALTPLMNTISSRDQLKPIGIDEIEVLRYNFRSFVTSYNFDPKA